MAGGKVVSYAENGGASKWPLTGSASWPRGYCANRSHFSNDRMFGFVNMVGD